MAARKGERDLLNEVWKDIVGYEGLYQVSDAGRVRSISHFAINNKGGGERLTNGRVLSPYKMPNGYLQVQLSKGSTKKKHYIHRLVAIVFLKNENNLSDVNHIDGNKDNNYVQNLEWCSHKDNQMHMVKNKLTRKAIPVLCIENNKEYCSLSEAERKTGFCRKLIKRACLEETEYKGYNWRFVNG